MLNHVQSRPNTTSQVTAIFIEAIGVQSCTTKIIVMIFKHNSSSFHWSTQICLVWSDRHTPHCKEDTMQFRDGILWSKCCFKSLSHLTRKQLWGSHWILMLNKRSKKASTHINIESPFKHNLSTLCYLFFQEVIKEALLWPAKCNKAVVPPVSAFWLFFSLVWQNLMLLLNRVYLTGLFRLTPWRTWFIYWSDVDPWRPREQNTLRWAARVNQNSNVVSKPAPLVIYRHKGP